MAALWPPYGRLMLEVLSLAARRLMRVGQQGHRRPPALAPALPTRDTTLRGLACALGLAVAARGEEAGALGESSECLNAKVYPGLMSWKRGWWRWTGGAGEAGVPPIRLPADRDRLGRPLQRAMEPVVNTPNLGE